MSNLEENKFLKAIISFLKSKQENNEEQNAEKDEERKIGKVKMESNLLVERQKEKKTIWKREMNPLRKVILWGYDENQNPSFLILYGEQQYKSTEEDGYLFRSVLQDSVKYTSYVVFKGKEGHLPAFQSVQISENYEYVRGRRTECQPKMYYKTGIQGYWHKDEKYRINEYKHLSNEEHIILPYFELNSYENYVKIIEESNVKFENFTIAKHPNEILKLESDSYKYYQVIYTILSDENLYMRKKALSELIEMNPPQDIYEVLLKVGSSELVSGLFLEFAKRNNNILIEQAKNIFENEIDWVSESYAKGIKRCAEIYVSAVDDNLRAEKTKLLRGSLSNMDLHLISINDKKIPDGKILEGSAYRKYSLQGRLSEYTGYYDYTKREWVRTRHSQRYKVSRYSDGVVLKNVELKSAIQEAEAYGLADVIGKIAYYLDAPRLNYYFRGNSKTKELRYYKRYIKRIIKFYAENDPDKYVEAMKALLTSYTKYDYTCKFPGNFQFNEMLKHYLYYEFNEKPPEGWENWYARSQWMMEDQLMKLEGRYEFKKEIWDNHLKDVLEIACDAKISTVLKACYYILKESEKTSSLVEAMSYKELVSLTEGDYEPLADIFKQELSKRLNNLGIFDAEIMITLMNSQNKNNHDIAIDFFEKTNGSFAPEDIVNLMMLHNVDMWTSIFKESIFSLNDSEYCNFVKAVINSSDKFINLNITLSEQIKEELLLSTNKISKVSQSEKADFVSGIVSEVFNAGKIPDWIEEFIEEIIFSISYEDLKDIVTLISIEPQNTSISQRSRQVIYILEAIKNEKIPSDSEIISILETGSSKMINILFEIIKERTEELSTRFSTLLIMFESDATGLNKIAENIFDSLDEETRIKLHKIIIDSPVNKVYSFGLKKLNEIYKGLIPEDFIIQMMEHTSSEVKAYISDKTGEVLDNLGNGNKELFMYYVKALIFLPNKVSKSKDNVYEAIPRFVQKYTDKFGEIENILLDIGGSNIIVDSERALTTLAKIRKEALC